MSACMGGCGTEINPAGMCSGCVEGARILNANALRRAALSAPPGPSVESDPCHCRKAVPGMWPSGYDETRASFVRHRADSCVEYVQAPPTPAEGERDEVYAAARALLDAISHWDLTVAVDVASARLERALARAPRPPSSPPTNRVTGETLPEWRERMHPRPFDGDAAIPSPDPGERPAAVPCEVARAECDGSAVGHCWKCGTTSVCASCSVLCPTRLHGIQRIDLDCLEDMAAHGELDHLTLSMQGPAPSPAADSGDRTDVAWVTQQRVNDLVYALDCIALHAAGEPTDPAEACRLIWKVAEAARQPPAPSPAEAPPESNAAVLAAIRLRQVTNPLPPAAAAPPPGGEQYRFCDFTDCLRKPEPGSRYCYEHADRAPAAQPEKKEGAP